ncbi:TPA: cationic peptide sensor histidine kinase CprS [Pseudomonas aeruginosa]|nr:cationic peptide sensor histidine kinase CprS [Pseudomonas aeruginosa]HEJ4558132.1 cationic peptide sensor histidine kinase CprS [Pseudomonas aeruginosa]
MKRGLSLIPIVGGGVSLILAGVLLVYTRMLGDYGETGALYLLSMMMEEEGLYFAQRYQEDPATPAPDSYYFKGSVGTVGLPPKLREMLDTPPYKSIGAMQLLGNWDDDDEEEDDDAPSDDAYVVVRQPLADGKTLYLYDNDAAGSIDTPLSDAIIDARIRQTWIVTLSVTLPSLAAVGLLVWFIVAPLRKLTRWSMTLDDLAPDSQRPRFNYRELNVLADTLWNSVTRIKDFSQREERFLRYASHELRTPLAVIGMNLELLDQPGRAPSPHALQRIRRSALGMQQMTETLLWLSRESGELRDDGHIEVGRLLEELLEEQQALSQRRGLSFHLDVEPHSLPQTRARIIIGNLLRNALQYSDEGVVEIVVRDRSLLISNPIGAAQGTDESMAFGYGLGLDLVQRLCQKSGWRMHYSSDEQRFRCELLFPATPD